MSDQSNYPGVLDTFKKNWSDESPANPEEPGRSLPEELNRLASAMEKVQAEIGETDSTNEATIKKQVSNLQVAITNAQTAISNINAGPLVAEELQNKVISGLHNTINNLNFDSFNANLKTTILNENSTDQQIISAKALYDFLLGVLEPITIETLRPVNQTLSYLRGQNTLTARLQSGQYNQYEFNLPDVFNEVISAKIIHVPDAVETIQYDTRVYKNDDVAAAAETLNNTQVIATANTNQEIDVTDFINSANLSAGDRVAFRITSDIAYIYAGLLVIKFK